MKQDAIFNSLGSQYRYPFSRVGQKDPDASLERLLENRYQGKAEAYFKGRHALSAALVALGIHSGDMVAIPGFTCYAVEQAVISLGAIPVFVDIDPHTLNISSQSLEKMLNAHPIKAAIYHYTLGLRGDYRGIAMLCSQHHIPLIEDLAHTISLQPGDDIGMLGQAVVFSFGRDKAWDAVTGGAAVVRRGLLPSPTATPSPSEILRTILYPNLTKLIRQTHQSGVGKMIHFVAKKTSLLANPIDASNQMQQLPQFLHTQVLSAYAQLGRVNAHRQSLTSLYSQIIRPELQLDDIDASLPLLRYPIRVKNPQSLGEILETRQIFVRDIWYRKPVETGSLPVKSNYVPGACPTAEAVSNTIFNLPTHLGITDKQAHYVADLVNKYA